MEIDKALLDELTAQAKSSPRLRVAFDLRTAQDDNSQRILNAMEPGTVLPIHRHRGSAETVVLFRGKLRQNFYSLTPDPSPEGEGRLVPTLVETLVIKGAAKSVNFTGDIRLIQAKNVYDAENAAGDVNTEHILLAPHHGGGNKVPERIYASLISEVNISVGPNQYGHPEANMLAYLNSICGKNLKRTDVDGDVVEVV